MMSRRIEVFFYGLFMDADLLRAKGARPENIRVASVPGFALRIDPIINGRAPAFDNHQIARAEGLSFQVIVVFRSTGGTRAWDQKD